MYNMACMLTEDTTNNLALHNSTHGIKSNCYHLVAFMANPILVPPITPSYAVNQVYAALTLNNAL